MGRNHRTKTRDMSTCNYERSRNSSGRTCQVPEYAHMSQTELENLHKKGNSLRRN